MDRLPHDVVEAVVQVFGRGFHFKDGMAAFLLTAGVDRALVEKYRAEAKYPWARKVLTELGDTEDDRIVQRRILTELCRLKGLPDENAPDRDAGLDALRKLKVLANEHQLVAETAKKESRSRGDLQEQRQRVAAERAKKLEHLKTEFYAGVTTEDRQRAGYSLEDILKELFALFEIEYRPPFKTETQQIDGHFTLDGFHYLVEARWRKTQPTDADVGSFKTKVDSKLESTRGLFVSVQGFREEVVAQYSGRGANIIFLDGADLMHILEGRVDLRDGLRFKVDKAAQEGRIFVPLK